MYHYVYRITNVKLNKHYYGKRSSSKPPKQDLGVVYFSSSRDKEFKKDQQLNPTHYKYKVILETKSSDRALKYEIRLHNKFNVGVNPNFYNKAKQTATGFSTYGTKATEKTRKKLSKALTGRTFSEEHKAKISKSNAARKVSQKVIDTISKASKDHVVVKDVKGNVSRVSIYNPDYLNGTLISVNVGRKASEETKAKQRAKKVKSANIYCYKTNKLIAKNVVIADWADENGYSRGTLSATANADRSKPSNKYNPHHHKGVYVVYNTPIIKENK